MAYDEGLAERVRVVLDDRSDVAEKAMFGGMAFMVRDHMAVGIVKDDLMVRVGPESYGRVVKEPHARAMDFTGRPMKGFIFVAAPGLESDNDLRRWVGRGVDFALSLPAKSSAGKVRPTSRGRADHSRRGRGLR